MKTLPGVRIGVKKAVDEDLLQIGPKQILGQFGAHQVHARQGAEGGDFFAGDILHR
jgi:hypothetical protein